MISLERHIPALKAGKAYTADNVSELVERLADEKAFIDAPRIIGLRYRFARNLNACLAYCQLQF